MLRVGAVCCGTSSTDHLNAWGDIEGVELRAVCDVDGGRARWQKAPSYADVAAMLAGEQLDLLDILTPAGSHGPLVALAAEHGLAVACASPLATSLKEARTMVEACAQAGVPLMVHESLRFERPIIALKDAIDSGEIGSPTYARIQRRHSKNIDGLGLEQVAASLLDIARHLLGEVSRIFCRTQGDHSSRDGMGAATMILDHEAGAVSYVDISTSTVREPDRFPQTLVRIEGDKGTAELLESYELRLSGHGTIEQRRVEPAIPTWASRPLHVHQASLVAGRRHLVECIRSGREPLSSGEDNLRTLELAQRAFSSAEHGRAA